MTKGDLCIGENVKISINCALRKFVEDETRREYEFPSSLTSDERKFVHKVAPTLGLKTKSRGKGFYRFLTAYKNEGSTIIHSDATFEISRLSQHHVINLLQRNGVTDKERKELQAPSERERPGGANGAGGCEGRELNCTTGRLNSVIPQVPPQPAYASSPVLTELLQFRQTLPIWSLRTEVMQMITQHPVVLISGDTGCGKTTQVPQFILEYFNYINKPCRIITAEPRRLAALSVAERVSQERGENIGQTVGYQIRLESKVSPRTLLTFCTNGVLLRTLMGGDNAFSNVTHVIVDEVHERDRFSDLLLLILRDLLVKHRNLKLILMSATFDTKRFTSYFGDCPVIHVPGVCHEVKPFFLEDILRMTGYEAQQMRSYKDSLRDKDKKQRKLMQWCHDVDVVSSESQAPTASALEPSGSEVESAEATHSSHSAPNSDFPDNVISEMGQQLREVANDALREAWMKGTNESFEALLNIFVNENISVDYQHSETGVTALIAATCHGMLSFVETFLQLGANIAICTPNDWNAIKWAKYFDKQEISELLEAYWKCCEEQTRGGSDIKESLAINELSEEDKLLLEAYQHNFNDEEVDINLILCLLRYIFLNSNEQPKGAVLIFLPGYDEIVTLRENIVSDFKRFDASKYVLYTLHSQMQSSDQRRVFKRVPSDVRKIILSTNLAETSITVDDVVFVIDAGKVKEKSFDSVLGVSMLKSVWISQSSAIQRRGRAGRCRSGISYHLFSSFRFKNMNKFQVPEILRMPIHELCLQTKLLAPGNTSIAEFLAKAPDPPTMVSLRNSVHMLKTIDALDSWEQLTELGLHLLDLPVEPSLGKMILYSVILKCLDPILTIVCTLAYRDPFVIPAQPGKKRAAAAARKKLSAGTFSDHMILLRGFQAWQKARGEGFDRAFSEQNFISGATMEMIVGMRAQLLGQLRASGFVRARGAGDIRDLNTNSENWAVVKAALCAGCHPNLIRIDRERKQLMTHKETKVRFHPSSVLNSNPANPSDNIHKNRGKYLDALPSDWFLYQEMTRIGRVSYARCCSLISPITVALFAGPARLPNDSLITSESTSPYTQYNEPESDSEDEDRVLREKALFKIDEWVAFKVNPDMARLAFQLRQKWHSLFLRRMSSPAKPLSPADEAVIKTVVEVLSTEEQSLGLQQPVGVGQRPRPMSSDFCPPVSNTVINSPLQRSVYQKQSRSPRQQQQQQMRTSPRSSQYQHFPGPQSESFSFGGKKPSKRF